MDAIGQSGEGLIGCHGHDKIIGHPHPDDIKCHVTADFDHKFIEEMVQLLSVQFWWEMDEVEIQEGDLKGMAGTLGGIDWDQWSTTVFFENNALDCSLYELCRKFSIDDAVKVIAGLFSREMGHVVIVNKGSIVLVVLQDCGTTKNVGLANTFYLHSLKFHRLRC